MAKKKKRKNKNTKRGSAARARGAAAPEGAAGEDRSAEVSSPAAAPLGTSRGVRVRPKKVSAKEKAAIAKKEARAKWDARMTAEGR